MRGVPVRSDINALEILPRVARAKKRSAKGQFKVCDNVGKSCITLPLHTHLIDADRIGAGTVSGAGWSSELATV
jgi:dTDP-4-amino-4,6-dideoxygalactose transaminase